MFSILLIDHRYHLGLVLQHSLEKSSLQKLGKFDGKKTKLEKYNSPLTCFLFINLCCKQEHTMETKDTDVI